MHPACHVLTSNVSHSVYVQTWKKQRLTEIDYGGLLLSCFLLDLFAHARPVHPAKNQALWVRDEGEGFDTTCYGHV